MVATKWLRRAVLVAGVLAITTTGAQALTLNVTGGGLEADNANYGCPTGAGNCLLAARDYSLVSDAAATGFVSINGAGTILSIELHVAGATFDTTPAGAPVTFGPATYLATITTFSATPPGPEVGGVDYGFGTGSVSGTVNGNPFSESPAVSISCVYPGGTGQCGITFGESGFSDVLGRDWLHTFNVTVALPEPTTTLLIALGLAGIALRTRSR